MDQLEEKVNDLDSLVNEQYETIILLKNLLGKED